MLWFSAVRDVYGVTEMINIKCDVILQRKDVYGDTKLISV